MGRYIVKRMFLAVPTIIGVSILVFLMMHLAPGDAADILAGPTASPQEVERIREQLGLDKPVHEQYMRYMGQLLKGDLGRSQLSRRAVIDEVGRTYGATLQLVVAAIVLSVMFSVPIGVLAAVKRGSVFDKAAITMSLVGLSFPVFSIGTLLLWLFAYKYPWFPLGGRAPTFWTSEGLKHILLPSITLALWLIASQARIVRSNMLEVLTQDYMRTARAKGLSERAVVFIHGLRNALLPITTMIGLQLGFMISGAVVTETIFSWPGVGRLLVGAILQRDFPVVQGVVLVISVSFVVINLVVDLLYGFIDPRIKYS